MKRYYIALVVMTLALVLATFFIMWFDRPLFQSILPAIPLYFAVITGLQHYVVVKSFYKDPRTFVKNYLGVTVGSLFLHLVVLCVWVFTHLGSDPATAADRARQSKMFILFFGIAFLAYLVFETVCLILMVNRKRKESQQN